MSVNGASIDKLIIIAASGDTNNLEKQISVEQLNQKTTALYRTISEINENTGTPPTNMTQNLGLVNSARPLQYIELPLNKNLGSLISQLTLVGVVRSNSQDQITLLNSLTIEEIIEITRNLCGLGDRELEIFRIQGISGEVFKSLTQEDLKEMGLDSGKTTGLDMLVNNLNKIKNISELNGRISSISRLDEYLERILKLDTKTEHLFGIIRKNKAILSELLDKLPAKTPLDVTQNAKAVALAQNISLKYKELSNRITSHVEAEKILSDCETPRTALVTQLRKLIEMEASTTSDDIVSKKRERAFDTLLKILTSEESKQKTGPMRKTPKTKDSREKNTYHKQARQSPRNERPKQ